MKDIEQRIKEIGDVANEEVPLTNKKYIKSIIAVELCQNIAKQSIEVIKHLQSEVEKRDNYIGAMRNVFNKVKQLTSKEG